MWGNTKTYKIVYYDNNVKSGDKRRTTLYESFNRSEAIYRFQQDYGSSTVVRDCEEFR